MPVLFRLYFALSVAVLLQFFVRESVAEPAAQNTQRLGLWIEAEGKNRPFDSAAGFKDLLAYITDYPFTDLYCQVYRGGRSWFRSRLADSAPYDRALAMGFDPLAEILRVAHQQGKRVHAWINVLRTDGEAPLIRTLGRDAVLVDNYGVSLLDYDLDGRPPGAPRGYHRLDTPGVWLDPSYGPLREYMTAVVEELLSAYPELDGIHLDMIRFPFSTAGRGLTFPFSKPALAEFAAETHKEAPRPGAAKKGSATQAEWEEWKRAQVTRLVFDIRQVTNAVGGKELSAAVLADAIRGRNFAFQDWRTWVSGGALDQAILMNYTRDLSIFQRNGADVDRSIRAHHAQLGIGAWLLLGDDALFRRQMSVSKDLGFAGVTLFSFSNLQGSRGTGLLDRTIGRHAAVRRVTAATK